LNAFNIIYNSKVIINVPSNKLFRDILSLKKLLLNICILKSMLMNLLQNFTINHIQLLFQKLEIVINILQRLFIGVLLI